MIDKLLKLKSFGNQKKQWHEVECNWSLLDRNHRQVVSTLISE